MDRLPFLAILSVSFLVFVPFWGCNGESPPINERAETHREKPNFVFILADDLGYHQLGSYGSSFYETPSLDQLAREGLRFTDAYAAAPVCSPTRASIMTGKYPGRLHLTVNIPTGRPDDKLLVTPEFATWLPLEELTIAEALKRAGYATGHFGKWHLNEDKAYRLDRPGDPRSQGFDDVLTTHKPGAGPESRYEEDWHHVREITERAAAFLESNRDRPFFCYVAHNSIHAPEMERESRIDEFRNKSGADHDQEHGQNNPIQAAMLATLDRSVGALMSKLQELGLERNTIVVFFSDNGQLGPKDGRPLRGSKGDLYEGGIRVPLIIRWTGVTEPGSVSGEPVISNDFFPTLCDLAGIASDFKYLDGVSLLPLLRNSRANLGREAIYWHFPHYHGQGLGPQGAVREGNYKLIEWFEKSKAGAEEAYELYDLGSDPGERRNLAGSLPDVTSRLGNLLRSWRQRVGAQEMTLREE
jgi:arylsulfatase A-like enzyme